MPGLIKNNKGLRIPSIQQVDAMAADKISRAVSQDPISKFREKRFKL